MPLKGREYEDIKGNDVIIQAEEAIVHRSGGYDPLCSSTGEILSFSTPEGADMKLSYEQLKQKIESVFGQPHGSSSDG